MLGCNIKNILNNIGLTEKDLYNNEHKNYSMRQIYAEYLYTDKEGRVLYKAIRYKPKEFRQAQYINGIWQFNMQNVKYVPYNLPNVVKKFCRRRKRR